MFCVTGWIEYEPSHTFSTPTDNWTCEWFGAHIFWHNTILLIFWNKKNIVDIFLQKTDRNVNVLNIGINILASKTEKKNCVVFPIYLGAPVGGAKFPCCAGLP